MINIKLDEILKEKKVSLTEMSKAINISMVNLSRLKTNNIKAIRFSTLNSICEFLDCMPGDLIEFVKDENKD